MQLAATRCSYTYYFDNELAVHHLLQFDLTLCVMCIHNVPKRKIEETRPISELNSENFRLSPVTRNHLLLKVYYLLSHNLALVG